MPAVLIFAGVASAPASNLPSVEAPLARHTQWQREAITSAYTRPGTTAGRVIELAHDGLLEHPNGAQLAPFDVGENTVRSIVRRARLERAAWAANAETIDMAPRDAVERLRRQLATAIDIELSRIEIEQAEGRQVPGEALRQVARAIREFAALPGPTDPRPPAPGAKVNGYREGSETRGGLAGRILVAHRCTGVRAFAPTSRPVSS